MVVNGTWKGRKRWRNDKQVIAMHFYLEGEDDPLCDERGYGINFDILAPLPGLECEACRARLSELIEAKPTPDGATTVVAGG